MGGASDSSGAELAKGRGHNPGGVERLASHARAVAEALKSGPIPLQNVIVSGTRETYDVSRPGTVILFDGLWVWVYRDARPRATLQIPAHLCVMRHLEPSGKGH